MRTLVFVARERGQLAGAVALDYFFARPLPEWGGDLSGIDFDNIYYYIRHEDATRRRGSRSNPDARHRSFGAKRLRLSDCGYGVYSALALAVEAAEALHDPLRL